MIYKHKINQVRNDAYGAHRHWHTAHGPWRETADVSVGQSRRRFGIRTTLCAMLLRPRADDEQAHCIAGAPPAFGWK